MSAQPPSGGRVWVDVPKGTVAPTGAPGFNHTTMNALEADLAATFDYRPNEMVTIMRDPDTGFWPHDYLPDRTPVYSGGAVDQWTRPTDRADVHFFLAGPEPSPPIVDSGTGGMLDGSDFRIPTP